MNTERNRPDAVDLEILKFAVEYLLRKKYPRGADLAYPISLLDHRLQLAALGLPSQTEELQEACHAGFQSLGVKISPHEFFMDLVARYGWKNDPPSPPAFEFNSQQQSSQTELFQENEERTETSQNSPDEERKEFNSSPLEGHSDSRRETCTSGEDSSPTEKLSRTHHSEERKESRRDPSAEEQKTVHFSCSSQSKKAKKGLWKRFCQYFNNFTDAPLPRAYPEKSKVVERRLAGKFDPWERPEAETPAATTAGKTVANVGFMTAALGSTFAPGPAEARVFPHPTKPKPPKPLVTTNFVPHPHCNIAEEQKQPRPSLKEQSLVHRMNPKEQNKVYPFKKSKKSFWRKIAEYCNNFSDAPLPRAYPENSKVTERRLAGKLDPWERAEAETPAATTAGKTVANVGFMTAALGSTFAPGPAEARVFPHPTKPKPPKPLVTTNFVPRKITY